LSTLPVKGGVFIMSNKKEDKIILDTKVKELNPPKEETRPSTKITSNR
jgi:hypothetical protein